MLRVTAVVPIYKTKGERNDRGKEVGNAKQQGNKGIHAESKRKFVDYMQ